MKQGIHPEYTLATVHCACGNTFQTRSTQSDIRLDVCSVCHPFFTGTQRLMDTAGRVERFRRKWSKGEGAKAATSPEAGAQDAPAQAGAAEGLDEEARQQAAADATAEASPTNPASGSGS